MWRILGLLAALVTTLTAASGPPAKAPSERHDLTLWNLSIPVANERGHAKTVATEGYSSPEYFHLAGNGAIIFRVPTNGVTTSHSHYPRTELRELDAKGKLAAWTAETGGTLAGELAVLEEARTSTGKKGRLVVGQIHGKEHELCRLYYDNGHVYFIDDKFGPDEMPTRFELTSKDGRRPNVPLGERFSYVIKVNAMELVVTVKHQDVSYSATAPLSRYWKQDRFYFKQGVYLLVGKPGSGAGTTGEGFGEAAFYVIGKPSHP